jgi:hypothetical protein
VITALAFVPSTPLLVPAVASGAAHELAEVRGAAVAAVRAVLATGPTRVVIVGSGARDAEHHSGTGSLRGFGVDLDVALDPDVPDATPLPLSLTIGAWLLEVVGYVGERVAIELDPHATSVALEATGRSLAAGAAATVLIVVADGSAARSDKAPASFHPEAAGFDSDVAAALKTGAPQELASIDRDRADAVSAQGWPAWYVAAAAAGTAGHDAELLVDAAPYGVEYLVASWLTT